MRIHIVKEFLPEKQAMRDAYCESMMALAEKDENIIALDADLMGAMGMKPFQAKFPGQVVDCGIQEANMIGVACGLAAVGKIPFAHTFGPFATRRACDQVFMSGVYAKSFTFIAPLSPLSPRAACRFCPDTPPSASNTPGPAHPAAPRR